ncbi:MAG: hypothetical protein AAFR11_05765 [Pseudomonadota bacterium]
MEPKPDPQTLKFIAAAKAAGLTDYEVVKRGRELRLVVRGQDDHEADDLQARMDRAVANGV